MTEPTRPTTLVPKDRASLVILTVRGQNVMLDVNLARLYGVPTKAVNRAVKRNRERFPEDFMFQLTKEEAEGLRRQTGTSSAGARTGTSSGWGGRRYLPYAFTEQGVAMLSSVLRSRRAVLVNIEIMRTFVRLRTMAGSVGELRRKVDALERRYDVQFKDVFDAIRALMAPPPDEGKRRIGFRPPTAGDR
jgi:ORF6N domain